jgi:hypothetical protein
MDIPNRLRAAERVIFSFGAFEKVKLYKARDFMAVSRTSNLRRRE